MMKVTMMTMTKMSSMEPRAAREYDPPPRHTDTRPRGGCGRRASALLVVALGLLLVAQRW